MYNIEKLLKDVFENYTTRVGVNDTTPKYCLSWKPKYTTGESFYDSNYGNVSTESLGQYNGWVDDNTVQVVVPGYDKEDISVTLKNGFLRVFAEYKGTDVKKLNRIYDYSISIKGDLELKSAVLKNGILTVKFSNTKKETSITVTE